MNFMNFLRYTKRLKAKNLMPDDWFRLGGQICRVIDVDTDRQMISTLIRFNALGHRSKHDSPQVLSVDPNFKIKIYNQK